MAFSEKNTWLAPFFLGGGISTALSKICRHKARKNTSVLLSKVLRNPSFSDHPEMLRTYAQ